MRRSTLEAIADEVHEEHCLRLDVKFEEPLVPRPFRRRPRPQTAIISQAAAARVGIKEIIRRAISESKSPDECEHTETTQ